MTHPLERGIRSIGRQARRLWLLAGLGRFVAIVLALAALLVTLDFYFRFSDRGLRIMSTASVAAVLLWCLYRFLWTPLRARLRPIDVAQRLERRFPELAERLSSSIEFLSEPEDDPRAGSPELRREVIEDTARRLEQVDLGAALDTRPAIRSLSLAMCVVLLLAALFALAPRNTLIGVRRLLNPLSQERWPQQTNLALRPRVTRVASGQAFEVEVVDQRRAKLPGEVWMHYRHLQPDGSYVEDKELLPVTGEAALARREQVTRGFSYRPTAGDDDSMPWTTVEVVDPPALANLQLTIHAPEYTALAPRESDGQLRAVTGSTVAVLGSSTRPLASAKIVYEDGREIDLAIAEDRKTFSLAADAETPLVVDKTGAYWFVLADDEGLVGGPETRYEMRAVPDLAPSVTIDAPAASSFATPSAEIPVRVTATDDLALAQVAIAYLRSDQSDVGEKSFVIYQGPERALAVAADATDKGERRNLEHRWRLADLGLAPGAQLTFHATASDYRPATGNSPPRQLFIVGPDELERRLEERHAQLVAELNRVLALERGARQHVGAAQIQADKVGQLEQADLDRLQAAELDQRQVDRALASRGDGLRAQLQGVLTDIENNQLDSPEIQRRTEAVERELSRLESEQLPKIAQALTSAQKRAKANRQGESSPADETTRAEIAEAARNQDHVIARLEELLGGLAQWDSQRKLVRDLADLNKQQQELAERTAELGRTTLSQRLGQLTPQQQADLGKLAAEQQELARRFDAAQQSMRQAGAQLETEDPLAAQAIADATAKAQQAATAGKMRQAGGNIEQNQIGQAAANQAQVQNDLEEMLDILSNRREHELARLVKKLAEAERELAQLGEAQSALQQKLAALAGQADSDAKREAQKKLAAEQDRLREQAERMARKLQRLQAQRPASQLAAGADQMKSASQQSSSGDSQSASQSADEARKKLAEAEKELAQARKQAESELAAEQFVKVRDQLVGLRDRQERAIEETHRLEVLRLVEGNFTPAQRESVRNAANTQMELAQILKELIRKLAGVSAFELALNNAGISMVAAAQQLEQEKTGEATIVYQSRALGRLENAIEALVNDPEEPGEDGQQQGDDAGGGGAGQGGPPGEQIPALAQLKLVKLLQEDLNARTAEVARRVAASAKLEDFKAELEMIVEEQRELAELIRGFGETTEKDGAGGSDIGPPAPNDLPRTDPEQQIEP